MPFNSIIDRSDAGALIPEDASNEIIQLMPKASVALSKFRQVRMSRKQKRLPVLAVLPTAYFVTGDTGLKQTTEVSWANKFLDAEELAVIVPIPENVLDDADFDIWGEIKPRIAEAMGAALDAAIVFGENKPASWPVAIVIAAAAAGNVLVRGAVSGQDVALDISDLMGLIEADGYDVNGFAAAKPFKAALRGLRTSQGELLFQPTLQAGTPDTLYGETINYVENGAWNAAQADLVAGDWTQGIVGVRQDITYKMLDQAVIQDNTGAIIYNLAQQDMVAMRVVFRVAFQVPNPPNRLNPGNNRYPFGILRPRGYTP